MSPQKYVIRTVADFAQVPEKRLATCLREFATAIKASRAMQGLLDACRDDLIQNGKLPSDASVLAFPLQSFTWTDDRRGTIHIRVAASAPPEGK